MAKKEEDDFSGSDFDDDEDPDKIQVPGGGKDLASAASMKTMIPTTDTKPKLEPSSQYKTMSGGMKMGGGMGAMGSGMMSGGGLMGGNTSARAMDNMAAMYDMMRGTPSSRLRYTKNGC